MFNRNTYLLMYLCFPMLFLFGCSNSFDKRTEKELSVDCRLLEKRIDDLSSKINLIIHDTNVLHNETEETKTANKTTQQKIEGLEVTVRNLNERTASFNTPAKTPDIVQPRAEEKDVKHQIPAANSDKSSDKPESDVQKTENTEGQLAVAQGFWNAVNANDIQAARSYVTKESMDKLQIKNTDAPTNCKITVGEAKTEDNKTIIETVMHTYHGTTGSEAQMQTILVNEDGQWKVDADQTMMSMFGGAIGEMTQTSEVKPDIIPQKQEMATISEVSEQNKAQGTQKSTEEITQASAAKTGITSQKQETTVTSEVSEHAKREAFLKDNIVRLAEREFPGNKGIQWNILSFEHKAHLSYVEVEPTPATVGYPRFKFAVSFKNPETPRVIGTYCFKDGQYSLLSTRKN